MKITPYTRTHKLQPNLRHYITELESLSIEPKRINELNDDKEMEDLVDIIKMTMYEDYKSGYWKNFSSAHIRGTTDFFLLKLPDINLFQYLKIIVVLDVWA